MAMGATVTEEQFRDTPARSRELSAPKMKRGRHEISSTSERGKLVGRKVAVAVAAAARTSTALTPLLDQHGDVVAHSGEFDNMSTAGQDEAHAIFHSFAKPLSKQSNPYVASAMAMHTALEGTANPTQIRSSHSITAATWVGGLAPIESPDHTRGNDDGYESGTERGVYARRIGIGREHLKSSLAETRKISPEAAAAVPPPSPRRLRGGVPAADPSFETPAGFPKSFSGKPAHEVAHELTTFAFLGFQTLRKK